MVTSASLIFILMAMSHHREPLSAVSKKKKRKGSHLEDHTVFVVSFYSFQLSFCAATMPFEETKSSSDAIALLKKRLSGFETEEGRLSGLNYVPKSKDEVMITTTPKAGRQLHI